MKRYTVVFEESAQTDVRDSYERGCACLDNWSRSLKSVS